MKNLHGKAFKIHRVYHKIINQWSPIYRDILTSFNSAKFTNPRLPINLGKFPIELARKCPNISKLLIKQDKSKEVILPKEILPLKDEIIKILKYDYWIIGK